MGREVGISVGISEALDYILYIPNYRVSVIISRGLYTFYTILEDHVFKVFLSENSVLMYHVWLLF